MRLEVRSHVELAEFAGQQHGVVGRSQLRAIGYSGSAIDRACRAGRLHRVHRGVYAVGISRISKHGEALAAVLACGRGALLSHASAAWLWGLSPRWSAPIHVSVPARGNARKGIHVHHAPALTEADATEHEGVPATSVSRTLLDLAAMSTARDLAQAVERAEKRNLFDLAAVESVLARTQGHGGANRLRRAVELYRDLPFVRSELERQFIGLVEEAGLPRPRVNAFVDGYELDVYWPEQRFAVELDGYEHHGSRAAFERDRIRQEKLKLLGIEMVRITARRVADQPRAVTDSVASLLHQRQRELARQRGRRA